MTESARYRQSIESQLFDAKATGLFTHAAYAVGSLHSENEGLSGFVGDSRLLKGRDFSPVFDLSSLTKALCTSPLIVDYAWSKSLSVESQLEQLFDSKHFNGIEGYKSLRLIDLLRHEAGLPFWRNFYVLSDGKSRAARDVLSAALAQLGQRDINVYSDLGTIVLGLLLEAQLNLPLDIIFRNWIKSTLNYSPDSQLGKSSDFSSSSCVPTGYCAVRQREICGEVHDENAYALGGFAGHSGLFGSLEGVSNYIRRLFNSDFGKKFLDHNSRLAKGDSALGWRTGKDSSSNVFGNGNSIGHMGFTGTAFWVNPLNLTYAILLTNRVISSRTGTLPHIKKLRKSVFEVMQTYVDNELSPP